MQMHTDTMSRGVEYELLELNNAKILCFVKIHFLENEGMR